MSYQKKRVIVSLVSGSLFILAYCTFLASGLASGAFVDKDLQFWAQTMLQFVGVGAVASIAAQIVFHFAYSAAIAAEMGKTKGEALDKAIKASMVEDEMDKLIGLKSSRIAFVFAGFGFVAALFALALDAAPPLMLNIVFVSFLLGAVLEGIGHLYFYKKGVRNG
ncbi:MAG: hypothetical protein H7246_21035 [Phycisphaerae bacterium]|nr:hypothetical protein [Saprospiraceae bacterium]